MGGKLTVSVETPLICRVLNKLSQRPRTTDARMYPDVYWSATEEMCRRQWLCGRRLRLRFRKLDLRWYPLSVSLGVRLN